MAQGKAFTITTLAIAIVALVLAVAIGYMSLRGVSGLKGRVDSLEVSLKENVGKIETLTTTVHELEEKIKALTTGEGKEAVSPQG